MTEEAVLHRVYVDDQSEMVSRGPKEKPGYSQLVTIRFENEDQYDRVIRDMPDTAERGRALVTRLERRYDHPVFESDEFEEIMENTTTKERTLAILRYMAAKEKALREVEG